MEQEPDERELDADNSAADEPEALQENGAQGSTEQITGQNVDAEDDSIHVEAGSSYQADDTAEPEPQSPARILADHIAAMELRIVEAFERKFSLDAYRERQIDRLHGELQEYKSDLLQKAVRPVFSSLIKLHGDLIRLVAAVKREDPANLTIDKVVGLFESFQEEIEDLLEYQGIQSYREPSEHFDIRRQISVGTTETGDQDLVGKIAERIRPGFEQGAIVLEKERVKVFVGARQIAGSQASDESSS